MAAPVHEIATARIASVTAPGIIAEVALPDVWDRQAVPRTGSWRYQFTIPAGHLASDRPALLIPRVGNSFEVAVSGQRVVQVGRASPPYPDFSNEPHLIPVPATLRGTGETHIDITVHGEPRRNAGLASIKIGDFADLEQEFILERRLSLYAAWVISACTLVIGWLSFMIWWRTKDRAFGLFALGSIAWAARTAALLVHEPPLPLPLWQFFYYLTLSLYLCPLALFLLEVLDCNTPKFKTAIRAYFWLTIPVAIATVLIGNPAIRTVWLVGALAITMGAFVATLTEAMRRPRAIATVLALTSAAAMFAAMRDWWVIQHMGEYATYTYVRFATPFFLLSLAWVLTQRYDDALRTLTRLNQDLEARVLAREREIDSLYAQAREQEIRHAKAQEREHLMRELHDGVGGRLATAVAIANKAGAPAPVQQAIHEVLGELRLALDVSSPGGQHLNAALAALRYRLQAGLEAAGFELMWEVAPLGDDGMEPDAATLMHVVRIVQEAINNAIKHSGGSVINIAAARDGGSAVIAISDNGLGARSRNEAEETAGRGLANMAFRAKAIGGNIDFRQDAEGSTLTLRMPVEAPPR